MAFTMDTYDAPLRGGAKGILRHKKTLNTTGVVPRIPGIGHTSTLSTSHDTYNMRKSQSMPSLSASCTAPPIPISTAKLGSFSSGLPVNTLLPKPNDEHLHSPLTVVFDLDETLCFNRDPNGIPVLRPYSMELLERLRELGAEIVLWTASVASVAKPVVDILDPTGGAFAHCIYRDRRWYKEFGGYTKELRMLGRDMRRTIIIENSPNSVKNNKNHAILVPDFTGVNRNDSALTHVGKVLVELLGSNDSVPVFLKKHTLVGPTGYIRCPTNDTVWGYETLRPLNQRVQQPTPASKSGLARLAGRS